MERDRRQLCIVYTGGTLGMRPSPRGYVPAGNIRGLLAEKLPELDDPAMPGYGIEEWEPPIDSANVTPDQWYDLARRIIDLSGRYHGFIVIHGTDTLAYTASALSFLLGGLAAPVVVTGAQVPLFAARNDARTNLLAAFEVAALDRPFEVSVLFGSRLMLGCRTTKMRARAFDAFDSPGFAPLADIGADIHFRPGGEPDGRPPEEPVACPAYRPVSVSVLSIVPGLSSTVIDSLAGAGLQGLVLECYGLGTAPDADREFLAALQRAVDAGRGHRRHVAVPGRRRVHGNLRHRPGAGRARRHQRFRHDPRGGRDQAPLPVRARPRRGPGQDPDATEPARRTHPAGPVTRSARRGCW